MKKLYLLASVVCTAVIASDPNFADERPTCEPGYRLVPETTYREVTRCVCKLVPHVEKKKKWVYSTIDEPFCIKRTLGFGCCSDGCDDCAKCRGPFCKKLLVKREVVEECPTMKCVVETIVEKVPCTTYRKVPIGNTSTRAEPTTTAIPQSLGPVSNPYGAIPRTLLPKR